MTFGSWGADELHVLPLSFKTHSNHVMFGQLTACPRAGQELSPNLRFHIQTSPRVNVVLVNEAEGYFVYTPPEDFIGIVDFTYQVDDKLGSSDFNTVTISVEPESRSLPSLDVRSHIVGLEAENISLDIVIDGQNQGTGEDLSLAICSCAHDLICDRSDGDCHCHLNLPDGWQIFDGERQLSFNELRSFNVDRAQNLILRAAPSSAAEHCLNVHLIKPESHGEPTTVKKTVNFHIHPLQSVVINRPEEVKGSDTVGSELPTKPIVDQIPSHIPIALNTTQNAPFVFHDLRVVDVDGVEGTYVVTVHLDKGGQLFVRQDLTEDVVFIPRTVEIIPKDISADKVYKLLYRFGTFKMPHPVENEVNNNGGQLIQMIGSLQGINQVLSTLTFVPWCADWPTPPAWPLPAKSWMNTAALDPAHDGYHPNIWPQWYPRFWYPFPTHHWSWWPRVIPPWWMNTMCSNWTSMVNLTIQEVPATSCQQTEKQTNVQWSANISVITSGKTPVSLVTSNLFTYMDPQARTVTIDTLHLRSLKYKFGRSFRMNLTVTEPSLATAKFVSSGLDSVVCSTIEECNEQLQRVNVTIGEGVRDECRIAVQIDMYENGTQTLGDRMTVWVLNTTRDCIDVTALHPEFQLETVEETIFMVQGSVDNPLNLMLPSNEEIHQGILHVKVYAEHGLVTMKIPDGLRIYSDHMGQQEGIPTYLCVAGPVDMVLRALATARFTPFKPLLGRTKITVDYGIPSTASRLLYGQVMPLRRLHIYIAVSQGVAPYMPIVFRPQEVCLRDSSVLSINMTTLVQRFQQDEIVTFYINEPELGSLRINKADESLYECPEVPSGMVSMCAEMCVDHDSCPDTQLCCSNGCGHTCLVPQLRAQLRKLTDSNQLYMHGSVFNINQVILRNAMEYVPEPCLDPRENFYNDLLEIRVIPSRNPEGDSVRADIPIRVTCNNAMQPVAVSTEGLMDNCMREDWSTCRSVDIGVCGRGIQYRRMLCDSEVTREVRPCMNCSCQPVVSTILDPFPNMGGCASVNQWPQCPEGCQPSTYHTDTVEFSCRPHAGHGDATHMVRREANVRVHDSCVCSSCVTSHHDHH
ncbi:uncharacterized protein [Diadema antillarum]|uniref:uncharacterized protein n=1 Tax=Diadema antillarum TaxID=105358 RepID=UPI003A87CA15